MDYTDIRHPRAERKPGAQKHGYAGAMQVGQLFVHVGFTLQVFGQYGHEAFGKERIAKGGQGDDEHGASRAHHAEGLDVIVQLRVELVENHVQPGVVVEGVEQSILNQPEQMTSRLILISRRPMRRC